MGTAIFNLVIHDEKPVSELMHSICYSTHWIVMIPPWTSWVGVFLFFLWFHVSFVYFLVFCGISAPCVYPSVTPLALPHMNPFGLVTWSCLPASHTCLCLVNQPLFPSLSVWLPSLHLPVSCQFLPALCLLCSLGFCSAFCLFSFSIVLGAVLCPAFWLSFC